MVDLSFTSKWWGQVFEKLVVWYSEQDIAVVIVQVLEYGFLYTIRLRDWISAI